MTDQSPKQPNAAWIGLGLSIGAGIGTSLGVVFDNIGLGVSLGTGLGLVFGSVLFANSGSKSE